MKKMTMYQAAILVGSIVICQLAGVIGSLFTTPAIPGWYATLNKPWFTPPSWVFFPVWTVLYILMGISLFLVLREGWELRDARNVVEADPAVKRSLQESHILRIRRDVRIGTAIFFIQLVLNILWSGLFFGLQSPLYGLVEIVILWIAILATILWFWRISRPAAILLIPYIIWVSIATALNYGVYVLNP